MADVYRYAASIVLLRPIGSSEHRHFQVLLLHKPRKSDAWQLPQGGVEGDETVLQAALRELTEEAGITNCRVIGKSDRTYVYDFPPSYRKFRPDNVKGQNIAFVFAQLETDEPVTVDGKEVDDYRWAELEELFSYLKRSEYLDIVRALFREAAQLLEGTSRT
jgi:putative (di)nucleoside polyphosphate hydrolase